MQLDTWVIWSLSWQLTEVWQVGSLLCKRDEDGLGLETVIGESWFDQTGDEFWL
jgi:hypothetical protein